MLFMKSPQVSDYAPWAKKQNTIQSWPGVKTHRHLLTERKKNDAMLWLAWIFEMETCMHFLIYKILFLLHSFTRNTLAAKSILSSPETNKMYYFCNLTKFQPTKKKKAHFFHSSKIKVLQSKKTRRMAIVIIIKAEFYLFCPTKIFAMKLNLI